MGFWENFTQELAKSGDDLRNKTLFDSFNTQARAGMEKSDPITQTFSPGGAYREDQKRKKGTAADEAARTAEGEPGREMARRDAIPLMQDESAMEAAKKRALLNQQKRSGRESTMLTVGLGK